MKTMIFGTLALSLLAGAAAQASTATDLARVRQLADRKISGSDVRKVISVYDNKEGNPCAETGISYVVKVQVRKAVMKMGAGGEPDQAREWQDFNQYYVSRADLLKGADLTDDLCME